MNTWLMKGYFDTIPKNWMSQLVWMEQGISVFLANHYATCKANRSGCSVIYFHHYLQILF